MEFTIIEIIQAMLAPGLMISACGLLLLAMNNKYSLVVNRIRLLNEERRKQNTEEKRKETIAIQLEKLNKRVLLVRNAVLAYSAAVGLFILASLSIGMKFMVNIEGISSLVIIFFLFGILNVLAGIIFAGRETFLGYNIIKFEIEQG